MWVELGSLLPMCIYQSSFMWVWMAFVAGWLSSLSCLLLGGGDLSFSRLVSKEGLFLFSKRYFLLWEILFNLLNSFFKMRGSNISVCT